MRNRTVAAWLAAQPGLEEFKQVTGEFNQWYYGFADLALAIGAVAGIVGGARVYANWQAGRRHIDGQVMGWFFSCLFLSIIGAALKALYGVR